MFVVEIGSVLTTLAPRPATSSPAAAISASSCRSRSGSGSPCSSPTSPRRWPRAAARRRPTRCGRRRPRPSANRERAGRHVRDACRRPRCARATSSGSTAGEVIPGRRRDHRGRRLGRRERHHRRVGAGHPRVGRRPLGGDRRHEGAVRLDPRAGHGESRRDVPRPDDRARRGRRAAEDAERDRAQHPAGGPDDRLPDRRGHAAAVRDLLGRAAVALRAGVAARVPHPDDDRRPAVGDRHRRHGPPGAAQRARDVGPRGRSRRRRPHAAARQDRHDHARQPPGDRVHSAAGRQRRRRSPTRRSWRRCRTRRRRAGRSSCWPRRSTACAAASCRRSTRPSCRSRRRRGCRASICTSHAALATASPTNGAPRDPQGRRRRDREVGRREGRHACPRQLDGIVQRDRPRRRHAARRRRRPARRSASST